MKRTIPVLFVLICLVSFSEAAEEKGKGPTFTITPFKETPARCTEVNVDNLEMAQGHQEVDIRLLSQDCIIWYSKQTGFKITSLQSDPPDAAYPFYRPLNKLKSVKKGNMWTLQSGPVRDDLTFPNGAMVRFYKPIFQRIDNAGNDVGNPIDPHIAVHVDK